MKLTIATIGLLFLLTGCGHSSIEDDQGYYVENINMTYDECKDTGLPVIENDNSITTEVCWKDIKSEDKSYLNNDEIIELANIQKNIRRDWRFGGEVDWYSLPRMEIDEDDNNSNFYRGNCGPFHIMSAALMSKKVPQNLVRIVIGSWGGAHMWTEVLSESGWVIINYGDIIDFNNSDFNRSTEYYTEIELSEVMKND